MSYTQIKSAVNQQAKNVENFEKILGHEQLVRNKQAHQYGVRWNAFGDNELFIIPSLDKISFKDAIRHPSEIFKRITNLISRIKTAIFQKLSIDRSIEKHPLYVKEFEKKVISVIDALPSKYQTLHAFGDRVKTPILKPKENEEKIAPALLLATNPLIMQISQHIIKDAVDGLTTIINTHHKNTNESIRKIAKKMGIKLPKVTANDQITATDAVTAPPSKPSKLQKVGTVIQNIEQVIKDDFQKVEDVVSNLINTSSTTPPNTNPANGGNNNANPASNANGSDQTNKHRRKKDPNGQPGDQPAQNNNGTPATNGPQNNEHKGHHPQGNPAEPHNPKGHGGNHNNENKRRKSQVNQEQIASVIIPITDGKPTKESKKKNEKSKSTKEVATA